MIDFSMIKAMFMREFHFDEVGGSIAWGELKRYLWR